jgi:hypothetical protein
VAMRDGGNVPAAAYFEAQLSKARRVVGMVISMRLAGLGGESPGHRHTIIIPRIDR